MQGYRMERRKKRNFAGLSLRKFGKREAAECYFKRKRTMEEEIKRMIEEALPLVDVDAEMLFSELDSLGVTTILMLLSEHYHIELTAVDATPKNFQSPKTLAALVKRKQNEA